MAKQIELFRFVADGTVSTFTTADKAEVYNSGSGDETYLPVTMTRDEIEEKGEVNKANLSISFNIDNPTAINWFAASLDIKITLTVFTKDEDGYAFAWKGRLASVAPDESYYKFIFESIFTSMRRIGLRKKYQRACPHVVYSVGCALDIEDFQVTDEASNVVGSVVTVPLAGTYANGYFTGGILEAADGTMRLITLHNGEVLYLSRVIPSLQTAFDNTGPGTVNVSIAPGCDRQPQTCLSKFDNIENFGGFPFIPLRNPFDGSSIV